MRTRPVATMTAAILLSVAAPFLSAAAQASTTDDHCEQPVTLEKKCENTKG
ncbi:MAG: hypothetical protein AB1679_28570 [Actinomycetota bacterium]|jgi:hypothetical protein